MAVDMFLKLGDINGESKDSRSSGDPVGDLLVFSFGDDAEGGRADAVQQGLSEINLAGVGFEALGDSSNDIRSEADAASELFGGTAWSVGMDDLG